MQMSQVREEHRKLQALAGTWAGDEKVHPSPWDPQGGTATARTVARVDLDGFFVISDYTQERGGRVTYRGHGVFGWDPAQKGYAMFWFDSMGGGFNEPARGQWEGNTLRVESKNPMGYGRYTWVFESPDRHAFSIEHSQDGKQWTPFLEGKYSRVK